MGRVNGGRDYSLWLPVIAIAVFSVAGVEPTHGNSQSSTLLEQCAAADAQKWRQVCAEASTFVKETGADVPRSEELMLRLAAGARSIGDFEGAVIVYRATVRQFPGSVEAYVQHAEILLKTLDAPFEAYGLLSEAIRLNPRHVRARELLGHTTLDMGRYEEALSHFEQIRAQEGPLWEPEIGRVYALRKLGRWDQAFSVLKSLDSGGSKAHERERAQLEGELFLELKEHQQAVAVFVRVLKDNNLPRFERWDALCGLAKALSGTGDRTGAVRVCQQAARVGIKPPCDCESKMLVRN